MSWGNWYDDDDDDDIMAIVAKFFTRAKLKLDTKDPLGLMFPAHLNLKISQTSYFFKCGKKMTLEEMSNQVHFLHSNMWKILQKQT